VIPAISKVRVLRLPVTVLERRKIDRAASSCTRTSASLLFYELAEVMT
jgi:hypothetical protein